MREVIFPRKILPFLKVLKNYFCGEGGKWIVSKFVPDYNFYGLNSAVVTVGSTSKTVLNNCSIVTNSTGSNAVFATDSGTFEITNIRIKTYKDSSRGLDSTYSGNITAYGININTEGEHCAPLATDRGEGWVTVFGNSNNQMNLLKSSGEGSPCVYSTGNITVVDVIGEATGSEAAVVEGKNSINLTNCELVGYVKHGIMLYQSMSMDADIGTALFYSYHSSITTKSEGPMIYITNTHAKAYFYNSSFTFTSNILLKAAADQWGDEGSNGGSCEMLIENMSTTGDVIAAADDSNLTLTVVASNWSGNVEGNVLVIKKDSEDDDGEDIVPTDKSQTLSRNAIIGIGVAAGVAVIALIAIIVYFVIKKKRNQSPGFNKI
ncbi:adhesin [Tritrichomonas foetus]|uniref:Adhesin n=1 Tax=Tritrichomonas foetus TaxID=1144522 RepID=A0A1J4JSZ7_9EUKA|nr:adhesin [Tritrichomonas foetus]|eukprot:OHT02241.1 adhesin [Tritrichomonas foetus]